MRFNRNRLLLVTLATATIVLCPLSLLAQVGDPHILSQPTSPVEPGPLGRPVRPYPTPVPSESPSEAPSAAPSASPAPAAAPSESPTPACTPVPTKGHETVADFVLGARSVNVTGNPTRFERYRDFSGNVWFERIDVHANDWVSPWFLDFHAFDPGLSDQNLSLNTGEYGKWRFNVAYDATPVVYSATAQTIFANPAPNLFTLTPAVKSQFIAAGQNPVSVGPVVDSLLSPVTLGYQRDTFNGGASYDVTPNFAIGVGYNHIQRSGTQPLDTTFFFINENELAAPVNDSTTRTEFAASYGHHGYDASFDGWSENYHNGITFVQWDNPYQITDSSLFGPAHGVMSTYPSNTANEVSLSGGANLGDVRVNGFMSQGTWSQSTPFLAQTSNSALGAIPNPLGIGASLPGNDQRFMENFSASARLTKNLAVKGWYRHYELDNSTPNFLLPGGSLTISDTLLFNGTVARVAYGFARTDYGADLSWRIVPALNTVFSYKHDTMNRTNRNVNQTDTDTVSVAADWHPGPKFLLNARVENGATTTSAYSPQNDEPFGLIDSDEAAQNFQRAHAEARWDPNDRLEFYGEFNSDNINYPNSFYGLQSQSSTDLSFGASYAASPTFSAYIQASNDGYNTSQASQFRTLSFGIPSNDPNDNWFSAGADQDNVLEMGFNWKLPHRWFLDVAYLITDGNGTVNATGVPGGNPLGDPAAFPNVAFNMNVFKVDLTRKLNPDTKLKLFYRYEDYRQSDFTTDVMVPYMGFTDLGAAQSVYLGATEGNYTANIFGVQISRRY